MPPLRRLSLPRSLVLGVSAVAVLLVTLASLQYRWLGQISEADQARLRASAHTRADDFARDFDREITRVFFRLQFDAAAARTLDSTPFLDRRAKWRTIAAYPALVKDVWLADPAWSLTIYNASSTPYTLRIMSVVALVFVPVVLLYQGWTYWVFRHRVSADTKLEY